MNNLLLHFDTPYEALIFYKNHVLPNPSQENFWHIKRSSLPPISDMGRAAPTESMMPIIRGSQFRKEMLLYLKFHSNNLNPLRKFLSIFNSETELIEEVSKIPHTSQFISKAHGDQEAEYFRINHERMLVERLSLGKVRRINDDWTAAPALPLISFELMKEMYAIYPVRPILDYVTPLAIKTMHNISLDINLNKSTMISRFYSNVNAQKITNNEFLGLGYDHPIYDNPFCISPQEIKNIG